MAEIFEQFNWWSVLDISIVSALIYRAMVVIRGTRSAQMLTGFIVLMGLFIFASSLPLTTLNWFVSKFYSSFVLIIIVLFQEDIRLALRKIGKHPLNTSHENSLRKPFLEEIANTSFTLAKQETGALIVLERNIILNRYIEIGTQLEAKLSKELILSIFNKQTPLHDGAIIIQNSKLQAAGCFLPLSKTENLDQHLGTRHRAALGITQETDALVILISEEKKTVSLVFEGQIRPISKEKDLLEQLEKQLFKKIQIISENNDFLNKRNILSSLGVYKK